ncbi:MAG: pyridoxamine 5'-phosphate oxidase family protein [Acidobacteria bacterium]|nr:pyridoxamine 5'-phosphate oxidase family protein [Acidobacteriota bacterium]
MSDQNPGRYDAQRFRDLIKEIPFAMFTTVMADGGLRSRPMVATANAFDGCLWFFTRTGSAVAQEVAGNGHVNVTYVSAPEDRFVSVSGGATVVCDAEHAGQMWSPAYNQWFAGGASDPDLSLIKIAVTRVEFWDRKAGRMQQL